MANVNLTRVEGRHKKRGVSVFTTRLTFAEAGVSGDVYELFTLPPNSLVIQRDAYSVVANDDSDTATADIGTGGGNQLGSMNLKTAAGSACFSAAIAPKLFPTGGVMTFTPTYTDEDGTKGEWIIYIEYIELDKTTGEVTNFSAT